MSKIKKVRQLGEEVKAIELRTDTVAKIEEEFRVKVFHRVDNPEDHELLVILPNEMRIEAAWGDCLVGHDQFGTLVFSREEFEQKYVEVA